MQTNRISYALVLGLSAMTFSFGCGDKSGAAASGSAAANGSAAPAKSGDAKLADGAKKGTAKYDYEKANAIYKDVFDLKNMDAFEKKVDAMKSKLGAPDKTDGDKFIWYAVDKDSQCYEFSASPTKGSGYETCDKAKCGL